MVLLLPWIAWTFGVRASEATENRPLAEPPTVEPGSIVDETFYAALDQYLVDHLPLRQEAAAAVNAGLYAVSGESPVEDAFVQRDGTWFLSEDFLLACDGDFDVDRLAATFRAWSEASGGEVDLRLVVAPDKSSIADGEPTTRTRIADNCQVQREAGLRAAFAGSDAFVDVWTPMRAAVAAGAGSVGGEPEPWYFVNDSHWTFRGAAEMSAAIVESLGVPFDRDAVEPFGEFRLVGDVTRRLGLEREEVVPQRMSVRPGVEGSVETERFVAAEGVRIHRSTSADPASPLVPGRTVVLHDSMGNYAEPTLAPYFEHVEFVHWGDLDAGGFFDRVAEADHVVIEVVQRDVYVRTARELNDPAFGERMAAALRR